MSEQIDPMLALCVALVREADARRKGNQSLTPAVIDDAARRAEAVKRANLDADPQLAAQLDEAIAALRESYARGRD